ncbi:MAG: trigger factor [Chitinophagales bacterium]|nr:trigger factor [Chitinophagaceae bacterium]MCB9063872.1 trigger factor [Chitinophagales bacterium]
MATVTRENIGTLHDKVIVKLSKEDYYPSFEQSLKRYAKTANIPGFRKGMVPTGMVKKMYGQSIFSDEVIRAAGSKIEDYLRDEKVHIFAQPMIMRDGLPSKLDMNNAEEMNFSFEIGLKPDFEIKALNGKTKLDKYKVSISDKVLDDEIERLQRRFGEAVPAETADDKEHIIYTKFEACDSEGNVAEGTEPIQDAELMAKLPVKLQDMINGKKADDSFVIQPKEVCTEEELPVFMKDSMKQEGGDPEQHYKMTITKVGTLKPHDLNEELFSQVFPNAEVKDVEAFRELLRSELGKEYDRMTKERLQNEMYELLVHSTDINLPVGFLKRWMQEGGDQPKTDVQVEQEFPSFDHQLRWTLISDKLIIDNNIEVSRDEVLDSIKGQVAAYFGMGAENVEETPWMDEYLAKVSKDEKTMDETYRRLLYDKLFDYLETELKVKEKEVTEEEFFKLPNPHDAHHHH